MVCDALMHQDSPQRNSLGDIEGLEYELIKTSGMSVPWYGGRWPELERWVHDIITTAPLIGRIRPL